MNLLEAIYGVPNLEGEVTVWKRGAGTHYVSVNDLARYDRQEDWYFHIPTHNRSLIDAGKRGSKKSAKHFTALWCDFDMAWKDPKYATNEEFEALMIHLQSMGIGPSAVVQSGGGYHLYWLLDKAYEAQETPSACKSWNLFLQKTLNELIEREIKIDQLGDMARVLRIPGTVNKGKLVQLIGLNPNLRYTLDTLLQFTDYNQVTERGTGKGAKQNRLLQAMGSMGKKEPSYTRNLVAKCGQVREFFRQGGDVSEPLWYSFAGLLPYTEDGMEYFINLSENVADIKDSDRSQSGAEAKVEQWREASDGPALCVRFHDHNPSICQACPHFKSIKTPLQIAHDEVVATVEHDEAVAEMQQTFKHFTIEDDVAHSQFTPPKPYLFNESGELCTQVKSQLGITETNVVLDNKLVPKTLTFSEAENKYVIIFDAYTPHDGIKECIIPVRDIGSSNAAAAIARLADVGHICKPGQTMPLSSYLNSCVSYMTKLSKSNRSYSRMGWRSDDIETDNADLDDRFVLGKVVFHRDGTAKIEKVDESLESTAKDLSFAGSVDTWREATAHFARPGLEKHLLAFMGGFGVPLMRAGQTKGLTVNLLSRESGTLKSFTLRAITSIYGIPDEGKLKEDDSSNAQMAKIARHCDIPVTYDEITHISSEDLSPLLYAMTSGKRGDKMTQDNKIRENNLIWRTVLYTSSNSSLDDKLQMYSTPERMRLLEIPFSREDSEVAATPEENRWVMETLNNNYGVAGITWLQYLVVNKDIVFKEVIHMINGMMAMVGNDNSKRFWISYLACTVVAAQHTRKLGLHSFDIDSIMRTARSLIDDADDKVKSDDQPLSYYLNEFVLQNMDKTQVLKFEGVSSSGKVSVKKAIIEREARNECHVLVYIKTQIGMGVERTGYIAKSPLRQYLKENRVTYKEFIKYLKLHNVVINENKRQRVYMDSESTPILMTAIEVDLIKLEKLSQDSGIDTSQLNTIIGTEVPDLTGA